jgi:hypothetical protein
MTGSLNRFNQMVKGKIMKTKITFAVLLSSLILLFLTSCVSMSDISANSSNLTVFQVGFDIREWEGNNQAFILKKHYKDTVVTLYNLETKRTKSFQVFSQNGVYYTTKIEPGIYYIQEMKLKMNFGNYTSWLRAGTNTKESVFKIEKGVVNNLGTLLYIVKVKKNNRNGWQFSANQNYNNIKAVFKKEHGSSEWNSRAWRNVPFGVEANRNAAL